MPGIELPLHAAANAGDGFVPAITMAKISSSSAPVLGFVERRDIQSPRFI